MKENEIEVEWNDIFFLLLHSQDSVYKVGTLRRNINTIVSPFMSCWLHVSLRTTYRKPFLNSRISLPPSSRLFLIRHLSLWPVCSAAAIVLLAHTSGHPWISSIFSIFNLACSLSNALYEIKLYPEIDTPFYVGILFSFAF